MNPTSPFLISRPARNLLAILVLAVLTWCIYGQTQHFGYVHFDDNVFVENNKELTRGLSWEGIQWAFSANFLKNSSGAEYWEPITLLTRLADYQFYGFQPGGHHLTSVFIHLLAGLALLGTLKTLTGRFWESFFVAALFLVHPMNVESVCWLASRKDLTSGLFYILALWAYAGYGKKNNTGNYLLLTFAVVLANLTKPMTVSLPFVFCLLDLWPLSRWRFSEKHPVKVALKLMLEKLPFLVMSIFVSALTYFNLRRINAMQDDDILPLIWRVGNAVLATGTYLFKVIVPTNLALLYPIPGKSLNLPVTFLSAAVLLAIAITVWKLRERRPWLLVGFLWLLVVLGPVIGIVQVGNQAMADRYAYLSYIGVFIAIVWEISERLRSHLVAHRDEPNIALSIGAAGVIGVYAFTAWLQTQTWQNSITAFRNAVEVTENNYIMHFNLGTELLEAGKGKEGLEHLQESLRIRKPANDILMGKAEAQLARGDYSAAIVSLKRVYRSMPWDCDVNMKLAQAYHLNGQRAEEQKSYEAAFKFERDKVPPRIALARSLADEGKTTDALKVLEKALQIEPANQDALAMKKELEAPSVR